ncbi:hypothetical protein BKA67DRAFT_214248 [Truncatella angustata]|uniref:Uncharacterized protein n=1 Tax=Truncatella angustata TaxID=152316 RepID=A0A9P8UUH9_9PEZI|nr:uncharacterized protein BKA67DRAFT_214248 [Truncatella angustata]KAH6658434.1 hypothetical protein BKA67DRAFT_214248 [Truncatella angustata]KAH8201611.1 hypothetical protein TruAng_004217 [Truncatella angustata]
MHLGSFVALGLCALASAVAISPDTTEHAQRSASGFVYDKAYRIRIAKNADYDGVYDNEYSRILPGLPDSLSQKSTWWFGYKSAGVPYKNIAVATREMRPIFYEQNIHFPGGSATWQAYTDHERWFRLSFKAQYLDEFDPVYTKEHNVFVNHDGDLALGAPAPTQPVPSVWGPAPGTWLVCQRKFRLQDVLAVRFAYTVLNETLTENIPHGCVPVKLESRCAPLEPLVHNKTWNHDDLNENPCVRDEYSLRKRLW